LKKVFFITYEHKKREGGRI
jgi:hypothetical protein